MTPQPGPDARAPSQNLVWFDRFGDVEKTCLGGKSASLGEMARAGLPVPPGFAITTHAFRAARAASGVDAIAAVLDGLDPRRHRRRHPAGPGGTRADHGLDDATRD